MKIAYIMKNYCAPSELWLRRQIDMLSEHITFLAATDSREKYWRGKIPVVNLSSYPFIGKVLWKSGIVQRKSLCERYCDNLLRSLDRYNPQALFVNYLSLAYDLRKALLGMNVPLVIHTHGYDITWDLISRIDGKRVYDEEYLDFARKISKKAILIANSEFSKRMITQIGVADDRVVVKYFGVNLETDEPLISAKSQTKIFRLYWKLKATLKSIR